MKTFYFLSRVSFESKHNFFIKQFCIQKYSSSYKIKTAFIRA